MVGLIGAVSLLIWGMRMVRTGITRAFGGDLRHVVGRSMRNRFAALLAGMGVTAVLQSSTATAFMVASFAGRGVVATAPALAVMLGADVGTTLVAQVLSFDVSWVSPLLLAAGVAVYFAASRTRYRQLGRAVIGLGMMLLALQLLVATARPLEESRVLQDVFESLDGESVIAVIVGALLTWLAHSSLAIVLLVMSLADGGMVPVTVALTLVVGANLGGAIPPVVATLGAGAEARRVPLANAFFKAAGCLAILPLTAVIAPYLSLIDADVGRQVVNFHTAFNLVMAAFFIGLTGPVAGAVTRLLPAAPDAEDPGQPRYLDTGSIGAPAIALSHAARETLRMGDIVDTMLRQSIKALIGDDAQIADEVIGMDDAVDRLHEEIKLYVTAITREELDAEESSRATEVLTLTTNLEHIGDIIENLMDLAAKKIRQRKRFSRDGLEEITALHRKVTENMQMALAVFTTGDARLAGQLLAQKAPVKAMERRGMENHMARLREGRAESIETSALHMDILRDLKRIHSHIVSVAYPVLDRRRAAEGPARQAEEPAGSDRREGTVKPADGP